MTGRTAARHTNGFAPMALLLIAPLALAALLPEATAAHGPDPVLGGGLFDQDEGLLFDWRPGAAPPEAIRIAIKAAAADVNATKASRAPTFAAKDAASNRVGYGVGATCGVNGIACFSRSAPTGFSMWFREQGHVFDWGTMKWCQSYSQPPNGCFDAETVALDEFGHVEGLDHHVNAGDEADYLDAVVQTYSHAKPAVGWNMHRFGVCDVATLQREYDVPDSATKLSTCLDLATTLTLSASPVRVASGVSTTLTATLRIGSSSAYERLKSNALPGRAVTLQRRFVGSPTWVAAGTMAAGSSAGTYIFATRPSASTEYRATFTTSTTEGLRGSASSVVTVTVIGCGKPVCPQVAS
jgi:hypothetical protein